jgi:DNA-binding SARP family transcriptional activator
MPTTNIKKVRKLLKTKNANIVCHHPFTIQLNYNAAITVDVDAKDEGEALSKAREMADDADFKEFAICGEREAQIIRQG